MLRRAPTHHSDAGLAKRPLNRARWAAVGAAVAVSVGGGGLLTATAVSEPAAAAVFVPTTRCRLADTRADSTVGPRSAPIEAGSVLSVAVLGANGGCTIPPDAAALVMNVTVVDMTESSFLTVYATDVARPTTANLNWAAGDAATANAVTASVSATGEIVFFNAVRLDERRRRCGRLLHISPVR